MQEEIHPTTQQLYALGLTRAELFVSYLRAHDQLIPAASPLEAAEARFVRFQEALVDRNTAATMSPVAAKLGEDLAPRGMHDTGTVLLGSGACGTISSGLKAHGSDVDYVFLYSGGPFPDVTFAGLEMSVMEVMQEYQVQHGLPEVPPCNKLNIVNLHFPNIMTLQQAQRELEYVDRDVAYYYTNSKPQPQDKRILYCFMISQPPEINERNRALLRDALCEMARTDRSMWERVTTKLKSKWRDMMLPLKVKHLFGKEFEGGSTQEEREIMERTFGVEQAGRIYEIIAGVEDLVAAPFEAYLDATGIAA